MVMAGAMMSLKTVWAMADVTMGLMTMCNLAALLFLGRQAIILLDDYRQQRRSGNDPTFIKNAHKEFCDNEGIECW
jgi:AGCS family alanine or glycine:cation symporter